MTDDVDLALPRPAAPSPTQSHGTVMVALLAGFVILAVLLWLSVRDVGPFTVRVVSADRRADSAAVTLTVTNEGGKAGHGRCRIERVTPAGDRQGDFQFLSERVPPRASITQTVTVPLTEGVLTGQAFC